MKKKFSFRAFVSLYIVISFLIMTLSGIVLFLSPPGRIANWTNWKYFGLLKSEWQAVHTIFTFIFVIAILFHIFFNWRSILAYLKTKIDSKLKPRKEILLAITVSVLIFILTLNRVVPFSSVMAFGESLKDSWSTQSSEPPIPHAEEQSLSKFAQTINLPKETLVSNLESKGIKIKNDSITIGELSKNNNLTPNELYKIVSETTGKSINSQQQGQGKGYGRKTISQICSEADLTVEEGINRLKLAGYIAEKNEKLKDVAARYNLAPSDIANTISRTSN
jgi:hypothetical protein